MSTRKDSNSKDSKSKDSKSTDGKIAHIKTQSDNGFPGANGSGRMMHSEDEAIFSTVHFKIKPGNLPTERLHASKIFSFKKPTSIWSFMKTRYAFNALATLIYKCLLG